MPVCVTGRQQQCVRTPRVEQSWCAGARYAGHCRYESRGGGLLVRARRWFGLPGVAGAWHLARTGEVWTFLGFPTYGGGPFERWGVPTSVALITGFVLVCAAELVLAAMILTEAPGTKAFAILLLPFEFAYWIGFAYRSARRSASLGPSCCSSDEAANNTLSCRDPDVGFHGPFVRHVAACWPRAPAEGTQERRGAPEPTGSPVLAQRAGASGRRVQRRPVRRCRRSRHR